MKGNMKELKREKQLMKTKINSKFIMRKDQ